MLKLSHISNHVVRTQFESLAQRINELRPKKPNIMNLKRVSWRTGL